MTLNTCKHAQTRCISRLRVPVLCSPLPRPPATPKASGPKGDRHATILKTSAFGGPLESRGYPDS
eukprot:12430744-Alexandrium_andersonii.AAC.1